uniref:Uncharacterized protein n=1 Tax=Anguilla anguilla TaxID=7936 RepID=A0A0E9T7W5_ANGAN
MLYYARRDCMHYQNNRYVASTELRERQV